MKTGHLDLRVEQDLVDKIDAWRGLHPLPPSRAAAISYMLEGWLKDHGKQPLKPQPLAPTRRRDVPNEAGQRLAEEQAHNVDGIGCSWEITR
jgi:hypothetical protein